MEKLDLENAKMEIQRLTKLNEELKTTLANQEDFENLSNPESLLKYYLGKYEDLFLRIYTKRQQNEFKNSLEISSSFDNNKNEEKKDIEAIQKQIQEVDDTIQKNDDLASSLHEKYEEQAHECDQMSLNIKTYLNGFFDKVVPSIKQQDTNEKVLGYVDFFIQQLETKINQMYISFSELSLLRDKTKELYDKQLESNIENKDLLLQERTQLFSTLQTLDANINLDEFQNSSMLTTNNEERKKDFEEFFARYKRNQMVELHDIYKRSRFKKISDEEIMKILDNKLFEYEKTLTTLPLPYDELARLQKKKMALIQQKMDLEIVKDDYDHLERVVAFLKKQDKEIESNITQMESFVHSVVLLLQNNPTYKDFYDEYEQDEEIVANCNEQLDLEKAQLKFLQSQQSLPLEEIYKVEQQIEIEKQKIYQLEIKRDKALSKNNKKLQDKEYYNFIMVVLEKKLCESRLPIIYGQERRFRTLLDNKCHDILDLRKQLEEYTSVSNALMEVENEINNLR